MHSCDTDTLFSLSFTFFVIFTTECFTMLSLWGLYCRSKFSVLHLPWILLLLILWIALFSGLLCYSLVVNPVKFFTQWLTLLFSCCWSCEGLYSVAYSVILLLLILWRALFSSLLCYSLVADPVKGFIQWLTLLFSCCWSCEGLFIQWFTLLFFCCWSCEGLYSVAYSVILLLLILWRALFSGLLCYSFVADPVKGFIQWLTLLFSCCWSCEGLYSVALLCYSLVANPVKGFIQWLTLLFSCC